MTGGDRGDPIVLAIAMNVDDAIPNSWFLHSDEAGAVPVFMPTYFLWKSRCFLNSSLFSFSLRCDFDPSSTPLGAILFVKTDPDLRCSLKLEYCSMRSVAV